MWGKADGEGAFQHVSLQVLALEGYVRFTDL